MAEEKMDHPDAAADAKQFQEMFDGMTQAIQTIAARLDHLEGGHGALSKLVTDDLIGGMHNLYQAKMRNDRIEGLKSKYGEMLNPHLERLGKLIPGDHWGLLHDHLGSMGEMDDEAMDGHVKMLSDGLKSRLDEIGGGGAPMEAKLEEKELSPKESEKVGDAVKDIEKVATDEKGGKKEKKDEKKDDEEPSKKSKDELLAEKMRESKEFKLR